MIRTGPDWILGSTAPKMGATIRTIKCLERLSMIKRLLLSLLLTTASATAVAASPNPTTSLSAPKDATESAAHARSERLGTIAAGVLLASIAGGVAVLASQSDKADSN